MNSSRLFPRCLSLLLCVLASAQALEGLQGPTPPKISAEIYLPRFEFTCSNGKDFVHCSNDELRRIGWNGGQEDMERQLADFTSLVFGEAKNGDVQVMEIKGVWRKSLKAAEADLKSLWESHGKREASRPWIIDDRIEIREKKEGELHYFFTFEARRVGQDEVLDSKECDAPLGRFSETSYKVYPQVGEQLRKIGLYIVSHRK